MFLLIWLVLGSMVSLFSPAYAQPVHLPLVHHVLPHSDTAVARSFLGVEQRNRVDASLSPVGPQAPSVHLIPISFGTPTQTLALELSFSLPGAMVVGCNESCSNLSLFNYIDSSSARNKSTSRQAITPLGETPIPGSVFTDVIGFGPLSILDASFFVIDSYDYAGIFGLGFPSASFQNLPSLWQSLLSGTPVDAPEMGIWLSRVHNTSFSKVGTPGVFTFGGTNSSLYTGGIEFFNSTSTSAWALNITKFTIQGHEVILTQSRNDVAFDVATNGIYGPTSSVAAIWAKVDGAFVVGTGVYQYSCSTDLNVTVAFGGRSWTLDPAGLNFPSNGVSDGQCLGAIAGMDQAEDQPGWIFGDTFLRGVYTVLRQGNPPAVGFAELSEQGGGAPSPTLPSTASLSLSSSSIITPQSSTPPPVSAKKLSVAAVVGGVVGGLVLCAALLVALLLARRRRQQNHPTLVDEDEGGVIRDLTPEPFVAVDQHPEMAPFNSAERRFKRKLEVNGDVNYPYWIEPGSTSATRPGKSASGESASLPAAAADVLVIEQLRNLTEEVRRMTERDPEESIAPPSYHPNV
ncbi:aspartic peptidase domain-containing protein [Favolaschia claudopus]|uniref:Aspartic peptidase domain-containing protein n=1 Tax=Favolaschia claudopus TaxID=2862362 RepID=A0AAV9Z3B7_9AGAR